MVLEQLFRPKWIEKHHHAFILGFVYSLIAIISGYYTMPSYSGMMSIAFTSILLLPSLNIILREEENAEIREKKFSLPLLFRDHYDIIKVYIFLFMGIFSAYFLVTFGLGQGIASRVFENQLSLTGLAGVGHAVDAIGKNRMFIDIVLNNLIVFLVCFFLSLIYGAGSILLLSVNASAWGCFFGFVLKGIIAGRDAGNISSVSTFLTFILPILPHTVTEALAYVFAAIVGGVVSKAALREKPFSRKFNHIVTDAIILLVIGVIIVITAGVFEVYVFQ